MNSLPTLYERAIGANRAETRRLWHSIPKRFRVPFREWRPPVTMHPYVKADNGAVQAPDA